MNELQAISMGLSSLKTAIDITKTLNNLDRSLSDAEAKLRLVELMEKLSDIREKVLDIKEENQVFRERIKELETQLKAHSEISFIDGIYWTIEGNNKEGPFCQKCYDDDKKLIRLQ